MSPAPKAPIELIQIYVASYYAANGMKVYIETINCYSSKYYDEKSRDFVNTFFKRFQRNYSAWLKMCSQSTATKTDTE